MAKRQWTEEQKQAARERLAVAREAKKNKTNTSPQNQNITPQNHGSVDPTVAELTRMVMELKDQLAAKNDQPDLAQAILSLAGNNANVQNGKLVGTTDKYSVNPANYSDPRQRLSSEPRLQAIAFNNNFELEFEVGVTQYETKDGISMREPKFNLRLNQIVLDDEGSQTNRRVGKAQIIFFEDPATAINTANRLGLTVDETNEREFLDEMRYMRMREWLFECFWPPKVDPTTSNKSQMVVGGQVVETWEVSTEGNAKIPFGELNSKLRA